MTKGRSVVGATVLLGGRWQTKGHHHQFRHLIPHSRPKSYSTDAMLSVSFIGYTSYEAKIGNRTSFRRGADLFQAKHRRSGGCGLRRAEANLTGAVAIYLRKNSRIVPFSEAWAGPCSAIPNLSTSPSRRDNPARASLQHPRHVAQRRQPADPQSTA